MSDAMPRTGPHRPIQGRRREHRPTSLAGLPTPEELGQQTPEQRERFPLYTDEQIEAETRTVRLDISFADIIKVRDQMEMVMEACRIIMGKTREHDLGSVRQRIDARREAASLGRALTRFNGKTPYGESRKKPRQF